MLVSINDDARALGLVRARALLCQNLQVGTEHDSLSETISELELTAHDPASYGYPEAFAALFARLGYPSVVPAGARLRAQVAAHGFKRISPLIDAYNIAAAGLAFGIGAHDVGQLADAGSLELTIRRAREGDRIVPLSGGRSRNVPAGDLIYTLAGRAAAWLGKRDVDADEFKLSAGTQTALFVLLAPEPISGAELEHATAVLTTLLLRVCSSSQVACYDSR